MRNEAFDMTNITMEDLSSDKDIMKEILNNYRILDKKCDEVLERIRNKRYKHK